jgi:glutamate/tyrosine decarboxylase-like PLP-dependent enzyme
MPGDALERTFDPEDWEAFSRLSHQMLDETLEHMRSLREQPAWRQVPVETRSAILDEPLPFEGQGEAAAYEQFKQRVLPYGNGNAGPRFFGWVQGNGTPYGAVADMLASAMNPHMAGFNQSPVAVEQKVIEWLRELMGFPVGASGMLLSGGSMANITALTVARNAKAGFNVREEGLRNSPQPLTIYGSAETHAWANKAVELLGLGRSSFRVVEVNPDFTINMGYLREMIRDDKAVGLRPIALIGTAGTVNTGATDDLNALADLAQEEDIWFHIDGAFGALAKLVPGLREQVEGLERADSVAFDLHKWMYLPFESACLLVRDGSIHRESFAQNASYISALDRGVIAGGLPFADLGLELTRSFKALKVWMSLKAYGVNKVAALIEQNVAQAQYLAELVRAEPKLEITAPVPLNIVCFRYRGEGVANLDSLNLEILLRLQERGIAVPSSTVINGAFCIRACIVNHRTRREDLDLLVRSVIELAKEIIS